MTEEIVKAEAQPAIHSIWTQERIDLLKRTICQGTTNDEFALFLEQCKRTGLDPFARQIYAVRRYDKREQRKVMQIQISIDGARLISERTGKYGGITPPSWCDEDEQWHDIWLKDTPPAAAKIGIYRTDWQHIAWGIATYREYVQVDNNNAPMGMWEKMPANQLVKCAESQAHRKAFPQELSGLYTTEEMGQVDNVVDSTAVEVTSSEPAKSGNGKSVPSRMWKGEQPPVEPPEPAKPNGHATPSARPWGAPWLKAAAETKVKAYKAKVKDIEGQAKYALASLDKLTLSNAQDRHSITLYLFGKEHSADLSEAERAFVIDWSGCKEPDYDPNPTSVEEARRVVRAWMEKQGQAAMDLGDEMQRALDAPAKD